MNLITLTGIDGKRLLLDPSRIIVATEIVETSDHGYTQILVSGKMNEAVVVKVVEAVDQVKEKIMQGEFSYHGGKL